MLVGVKRESRKTKMNEHSLKIFISMVTLYITLYISSYI